MTEIPRHPSLLLCSSDGGAMVNGPHHTAVSSVIVPISSQYGRAGSQIVRVGGIPWGIQPDNSGLSSNSTSSSLNNKLPISRTSENKQNWYNFTTRALPWHNSDWMNLYGSITAAKREIVLWKSAFPPHYYKKMMHIQGFFGPLWPWNLWRL